MLALGTLAAACGGSDHDDAAAHVDHADAPHDDHGDAGHGDSAHGDGARHSDTGHSDAPHTDSATPSTTAHQDLGPAPTEPEAGPATTRKREVLGEEPHADSHVDIGSGHVDIPHSDFAHGDENTGGHTDSPQHGDQPYSDNTRPIGP